MLKKACLWILILTTPFWIVGLSARAVFSSWFIHYEYSKKDFPKDRYGMNKEIRKKFALLGLKAVTSKEGLKEFEKARFPSGIRAFKKKEVKHMKDVNRVLSVFFPISYLLFAFWIGCVFFLKKERQKLILYSGLFSLILLLFVGAVSLLSYEKAFEVFHNVVFDKVSWRFKHTDTLLRIYPMKFWFDGTVVVFVISVIISALIFLAGLTLKKRKWYEFKRANRKSQTSG